MTYKCVVIHGNGTETRSVQCTCTNINFHKISRLRSSGILRSVDW